MTFDENGNLATLTDAAEAATYIWDPRNRLAGIGAPSLGGSFAYDPLGRRTVRTINGQSTSILYDGSDVNREGGANGDAAYLRTLAIDETVMRSDAPGMVFYLTDALGSTIALADPAGALLTTYTYTPFGDTAVTGSANANPFQFTGRENDGTGLYDYRARYYQPSLQRFVSNDPLLCGEAPLPLRSIKNNPQYLHTYAYVGNAPTLLRDPLGLSPECAYYDQRCGQVTSGIAKAYHCTAAKTVCEKTPRGPYSNCVRQCLQDVDRETCIPIFGRKDPAGLGALACNLPAHPVCFQSCLPKPGPFPVP
jgi:RHS repeat-associated protein